ncbi:hypothetical protein FVE85_3273 [Porphyridium purpureum]|uniref:Uncharacterized protein n=1 Tax=Porphyridium purpureum TaxID=35688 RepID=A0A5J4YW44_PORPP|nr:hypothetical protein FVE85_3273 [Porphyridium purpureum]|eukprot:POR0840..scf227_4
MSDGGERRPPSKGAGESSGSVPPGKAAFFEEQNGDSENAHEGRDLHDNVGGAVQRNGGRTMSLFGEGQDVQVLVGLAVLAMILEYIYSRFRCGC